MAIDDASRLAYVEVLPDQRGVTAVAFLGRLRTKPYWPESDGKAERFIQTMLIGWAHKRAYRTSNQRGEALPVWLR